MEFSLDSRISKIPEAISVAFNQKVYEKKRNGSDVITLSLGEAFFDIPKFSFDDLDFDKGYHYTDSQGLPELRKKIADYYNNQFKTKIIDNENLIISAGSKILIYMAVMCSIEPEDEVIVLEPAWLSYEHQISLAGGVTRFVPINENLEDLAKYISTKTRMVIINNPNNPAGKVYTKETLIKLVEICKKNNIKVLVDEAYSDFVEENKFYSIASLFPDLDNIIVINSLSKTMGISGWRIGFAIAKSKVINDLLKINQHLITCAPSILQMYLSENFEAIQKSTISQARSLNSKRKKVELMLDKAGISYAEGSSTFYIFINLEGYFEDTYEFAENLLDEHLISMVPGRAYGKSTKSYLRMSIGVESLERIEIAINTLSKLLKNN